MSRGVLLLRGEEGRGVWLSVWFATGDWRHGWMQEVWEGVVQHAAVFLIQFM